MKSNKLKKFNNCNLIYEQDDIDIDITQSRNEKIIAGVILVGTAIIELIKLFDD